MDWIARFIALAFLVLGAGPLASAEPRVDRNCSDDRGKDRCSAEQQKRVRELFGVKSIEEHSAAGDQVRRAFYVDGYGRDVVAIAFVRSPGREPMLRVHFPLEDKVRVDPLTAPVPEDIWREVIERSAHFDKRLHPLPEPEPEGTISLCIHSWVFTIEAADPARTREGKPTIRRRTEDACEDGLGEAYATGLYRAAVPLFPHCARLDRAQHRNEASLLSACRLLTGDRLAAAEVMNRVDAFLDVEGAADAPAIRDLFEYDSIVDWNGVRNEGSSSAAAFWAQRIGEGEGEGEGRTILYYDTIRGENADRVILTGLLSRSGAGDTYLTARVEQIWKREGGQFVIERISVGPFETPARP
jgi:hypothetical protein